MDGLKLLLVFIFIMFFLWCRKPLPPVMLGGSVILAVLYRTTPFDFIGMAWRATRSTTTIKLEVILIIIMIFEYFLRQEGYLKRMLNSLMKLIRNPRLIIAFLPAFIGLMPSMGGALFSAPLVGQAASGTSLTPEEKSYINYYYRHIWEYCLPLYPGLLLTSSICNLPLQKLILALAPYTFIVAILGFPVLRKIPPQKEKGSILTGRWSLTKEVLLSISPVLFVVVMVLLLQIQVGFAVGLVLIILLLRHGYTLTKIYNLCKEAIQTKTLFLVWGIMLFKQVILDTHAVNSLSYLLESIAVPQFIVLGMFGFIVGLLVGTVSVASGIIYPILIAAGGQVDLALIVLIFVAAFTGVMLTPMHLCLVLTSDYFKADLYKVLRMAVVPQMVLLAAAVIIYLFV
ncbi:MAG: uncharacterized protein PWP31_1800 [Clostridia bacterium]|nr:uncharacterized protein [Clostridia bacterium]